MEIEGVLKQQSIGADGLYVWQRKHFRIDEYGNFLITSVQNNEDVIHVPLAGAKYAKEWSFSSALSGYGFDLVWSMEDDWSFIVDDENSCLKWVAAINAAIKLQKGGESSVEQLRKSGNYEEPNLGSTRNSHNGIAALGYSGADMGDEEYALRTIEKHQQFLLSGAATNTMNTTQPYFDAPYGESKIMTDAAHKSVAHSELFEDLPLDVKGLRSLQPSTQQQQQQFHPSYSSAPTNSGSRQRYGNQNHAQQQDHGEDDTQEEIASQQSQQSYSQPAASSIASGGNYPAKNSNTNNPLNSSQNHKDYFRADVSKALFDHTGNTLYEPPPPPPVVNSGLPPTYPPVRSDHQRNEYLENMKNIFATTKKSLVETEHEIASLRSSQPNPDHLSLQIRCQHLQQQLDVKEQEVEKAQSEHYRTKLEFEERMKKMNDELDGFRNREHDLLAKFKQEIDHRVLRASNENNSYFEASLKSLKAQHQRELRLLQDELNEERKNGSGQVEKEIQLRKRAESTEQSLRKELLQAQDRISSLEIDLQRVQSTSESTQSSWSREKSRLVAEYTHQIQQLATEKEAIEQEAQRQLQQKIAEMNKKWETSIHTLKGHEMEIMRQQWESDHARSLIELQKKCQRDIESVRSEERTLAAQEMDSLRSAFLQRERQTSQDLIELEKLHAKRVQQLDFQYQQEKTANDQLKQRLNDLLLDQERRHQDTTHQSDSWQRKNHELTLQNDQLKRDLKAMQEQVADSKAGENASREQLRQLSMELKLMQAERAELQRQATGHGVETNQWKQVVHEQEKNYHTLETTTRVAKEEIAFLEHENHRLKTENAKLRMDMEKADRLIYGVSQHNTDNKRAYAMKLDGKFSDAGANMVNTTNLSQSYAMNASFAAAPQQTPVSQQKHALSIQTTPIQRLPSGSSSSSKFLDNTHTTVLSHSRNSAHRHSHYSPTHANIFNNNRSPRRTSPTSATAGTMSSAMRSTSAAKRR